MDRDAIFDEMYRFMTEMREEFKKRNAFDPDDFSKVGDLGRGKAMAAYHAKAYNWIMKMVKKMEAE